MNLDKSIKPVGLAKNYVFNFNVFPFPIRLLIKRIEFRYSAHKITMQQNGLEFINCGKADNWRSSRRVSAGIHQDIKF